MLTSNIEAVMQGIEYGIVCRQSEAVTRQKLIHGSGSVT